MAGNAKPPNVNYSARKTDGTYREMTVAEWKVVRQMAQAGKTSAEVAIALGNTFSPGVIYDRGKARGMTFGRKSAHMGRSGLSLGGKYEEKKFERDHPATHTGQTDC